MLVVSSMSGVGDCGSSGILLLPVEIDKIPCLAKSRRRFQDLIAIDWDDRPRHIVREIGRKELDDFGAILDRPEPPQRDQFGPVPVALNAPRYDRRHDPPGGNCAWGHAVHRDPERPKILSQIPRVMGDSAFAAP